MDVFVSSTYRNLADYREVLRLALETSGYRFRGMEHFGPQDRPPLEVCLNQLGNSDVYLGLIGGLYGSSPYRRRLSYTELEYRHASEIQIYRVVLVIDQDADVRMRYVEQDPQRAQRLARFRSRVMNDLVVETFSNPHEAAWKALAGLRIYEQRIQEENEGND